MSNGLFRNPRGGKTLVIDGEARYFPPLRPQMALDALPRWALDESEQERDADFTADDAALAEHIGAAVCDAIKSFRRKGRDETLNREDERLIERSADRAGNMTSQNRDALPDPQDHRQDFRSGDARRVTRDELDSAIKAAISQTRARERGMATDSRPSARITGIDRAELLGLN